MPVSSPQPVRLNGSSDMGKFVGKSMFRVIAVLSFCFLPLRAFAQCTDEPCQNLQTIFNSAQIDFREYRGKNAATPPGLVSSGISVPCQINTWANNVPMYICVAAPPLAGADLWFRSTLGAAKRLQSSWQFKINSAGTDQYVEGG